MASFRSIFVIILLLGIFFISFNTLLISTSLYYNTTVGEEYTTYYGKIEQQTNATKTNVEEMRTALSQFQASSSVLDKMINGFVLTGETIKFIFTYPFGIIGTAVSMVSASADALNIPSAILSFAIAAIVIYLLYLIIRALMGGLEI